MTQTSRSNPNTSNDGSSFPLLHMLPIRHLASRCDIASLSCPCLSHINVEKPPLTARFETILKLKWKTTILQCLWPPLSQGTSGLSLPCSKQSRLSSDVGEIEWNYKKVNCGFQAPIRSWLTVIGGVDGILIVLPIGPLTHDPNFVEPLLILMIPKHSCYVY